MSRAEARERRVELRALVRHLASVPGPLWGAVERMQAARAEAITARLRGAGYEVGDER